MNISYLIDSMRDYIDAPMPFIIGVRRDIWRKIKKERKKQGIPGDVAILDLDKGTFKADSAILPDFPPKLLDKAFNDVTKILEDSGKEDVEKTWVRKAAGVKAAVLKLYLGLLGNFQRFYKTAAPAPVDGKTVRDTFRFSDYLASLTKENKAFMKEFVKTQSFLSFIEKMLGLTQSTGDTEQFLHLVGIMNSKGEKAVSGILATSIDYIIDSTKTVWIWFLV